MGVFKGLLILKPLEILPVPSKALRVGMLEVVRKLKQCPYGHINTQQHKLLVVGKALEAVKHLS